MTTTIETNALITTYRSRANRYRRLAERQESKIWRAHYLTLAQNADAAADRVATITWTGFDPSSTEAMHTNGMLADITREQLA